ncbi:MAG: hypothetical protein ABIT71_02590 [Vicinamibacteraceae bacterium]
MFTYLPSLTDPGSGYPQSINDRGEIAGSSQAADGTRHAVLWRDGAIVDLGLLPGSFNTAAMSINDRERNQRPRRDRRVRGRRGRLRRPGDHVDPEERPLSAGAMGQGGRPRRPPPCARVRWRIL